MIIVPIIIKIRNREFIVESKKCFNMNVAKVIVPPIVKILIVDFKSNFFISIKRLVSVVFLIYSVVSKRK